MNLPGNAENPLLYFRTGGTVHIGITDILPNGEIRMSYSNT